MTRDMVDDDNWALGSPPTSPTRPNQLRTLPSTTQSPNAFISMGGAGGRGGGGGGGGNNPTVNSHMSSSTDQLARRDMTSSPAMASDIGRHIRPSSAGSNSGRREREREREREGGRGEREERREEMKGR